MATLAVSHTNGVSFTNGDSHINGKSYPSTNGVAVNGGMADHDASLNGYKNRSTGPHTNGINRPVSTAAGVSSHDLIAVCGLGIRLPGGIRDAEGFWDLIVNRKDAKGSIRSDRYSVDSFKSTLGSKGAIKTQSGYFLDDDLTSLDTSFFSMSKNELERSDPQQRQLLEVTRECLENAGEVKYRGKSIGCYVGTFGEDWLQMSARETQHSGGYILTGHGDLMISNRVSYEYDFRGPSMVIKTGCSASLVALHEATRALRSGDCDGAIVAGTSLIMGPSTTAAMTQEGILSPEGSCKPFDASADGFARAEAINAVYVKRLSDALKDGNPIRAIIRNTGTNSDGRSQGLMTPHSEAQEALMRKVYSDAQLSPSDTGFIECHGTGTPTGDPLETAAVGRVFGEKGIYIGSVKANVGHSEGASGITSLIKVILALNHETIPPNIKFDDPNPKIPFKEHRLVVPTRPMLWPHDRCKRASVNSFGIGGTNAHVILESPDAYVSGQRRKLQYNNASSSQQLLALSANTQESMRQQVQNTLGYIENHPDRLRDVVYTLNQRREHLWYRTYCVISAKGLASESVPIVKLPTTTPDLVMVFSGQGAQWPAMGRELMLTDSSFRNDIEAMDAILQTLKHPLLGAWKPVAVVGHSSGEIAAAYAAGGITHRQAIIASYYRGYVAKTSTSVGGMAAVGLGEDEASHYLTPGVTIACENSPTSVTLSGDLDKLEAVIATIKKSEPDVLARKLKVNMAYHSHHMVPLSQDYRRLLEEEFTHQGATSFPNHLLKATMYSSAIDDIMEDSTKLNPTYWQTNLSSPVHFYSALQKLLHKVPNNVLVEIGPHSTLAGPLRQICSEIGMNSSYIPTMIRGKDCSYTLIAALGQLYQQGISFNFEPLTVGGKVLTDLPLYPWDHGASFWYESRLSKDWRFRDHGHHGLLGLRVGESARTEPSWRNILSIEDEPWLYDHKVRDDIVFPFAGYAAMVGEAIRQLSGIQEGYSLRHVVVHSALVLADSKPVEMITSLRPHKLNDSLDSDWFEFTITSNSGATWMKNCEGQVKARQIALAACESFRGYPREVPPERWYAAMSKIGFNYGPEFSGLRKITSSTTENLSVGEIENPLQGTSYLFHPTAIDACLQLLLVAMSKGIGRNFEHVAVPTRIEEIDVAQSAERMSARAGKLSPSEAPGIDCVSDSHTCLRLRGVYLTPMDDEESLDSLWDRHAAARLEWSPDIDFLDVAPLFKPPKSNLEETTLQEKMTLLCIVDSAERLRFLKTEHWHFKKYRGWLQNEVQRAKDGMYPILTNGRDLVDLPPGIRKDLIEEHLKQLSDMGTKAPVATGIKRINDNIESIFTGKLDTLDLLMQGDLLTEIYNVVSFGHGEFVRALSHTKPSLHVLEVGAGTGGTTASILEDLVDENGYPLYSLYTFTDISAGFFPQAKERFSFASNIDYKVFDISKDPFSQGFEPDSYDLILAPNVIHATPSLHETLCNLRPLLRPNGHLVLTELSALVRAPNYIFGNFEGWWLGEADGRPNEPYVSVDRWDEELKAAGFSGVDTAVLDAEPPYQYCAAIISQPDSDSVDRPMSQAVTLLCEDKSNSITTDLIAEVESLGMKYTLCNLGDSLPEKQNVVATIDLESSFFESITEDRLRNFQELLSDHEQSILWLTKPSQILCTDPSSAQTIGAARSIRSELGAPFVTLEIEPKQGRFGELVMRIFKKVESSQDTGTLAPDREYAVSEGIVSVGRYHPFSLQEEMCQKSLPSATVARILDIKKPGLMQTFQWSEKPIPELGANEVEVEVAAVGLNFRDVLLAMGILRYGVESVSLGIDAAGTVRRTGSNVGNVAIGDRIFALAPYGCITDRLILPMQLAIKIPNNLSFEDAATMPCCFATAIHSLLNVGELKKGKTALIHSASGGVGYASLQVCAMIGVEVFVTVGNEAKAKHLVENLKIPRDRIFNSRDDSFYADIMRETNGKGVDLVLNSLSGELLHASWRCVAEFGKLVELGKRDIVEFGKLEMDIFEANRSYCCVDIAHLVRDRPEQMADALQRCLLMFQVGQVTPIQPLLTYEPEDATEAFRCLQNGDHIGKVVLKMPQNISTISSVRSAPNLTLDPKASYILAGGLGGLGRSIATWMAERGARSLIFLSRSAGRSDSDQAFFAELQSMGCRISAVTGMTQIMEDVKKAVASAPNHIKGVIQLAMALRDKPMTNFSLEEWRTATAPKVEGTWNLHNALAEHPLDFFFMSSSTVNVVNQPGQGNYSAANTFLEAFCQYRHSLGLPASVLNICPIDDVGFVSENPAARKSLKAQGHYFLDEKDFLDYLQLSIFNSHPPAKASNLPPGQIRSWKNPGQIVMGLRSEIHPDDPNNRTHWRRDRRMGIYHNIKNTNIIDPSSLTSDNQLKQFLTRCAENPDLLGEKESETFLAQEIGQKVYAFMLKDAEDMDIEMTLTSLGVDSLMAIELRRWWKQAFGLEMSVLEIMGSGTIKELGKVAAQRLKLKLGGEES